MTSTAVELLHTAVGVKDGGERRAGQDDMCSAVADAMRTGRHLLVEAPTGTGKSLAYLVPAVEAAVRARAGNDIAHLPSEARSIIATATKALQEQLINEDLPFLARTLDAHGMSFSFSMLKGRSNYWCRARAAEMQSKAAAPQLFSDGGGSAFTGDQFERLASWAEASETGDLGAYDEAIPPKLESAVTVSSSECPGAKHCPFGETCFAEAARARAAQSDIVVVNTALYASHLASGGHVLPEHGTVIVDEVHELEDIVTRSFGLQVNATRIRALASRLPDAAAPGGPASHLRAAADALDVVLDGLDGERVAAHAGQIGDVIDLVVVAANAAAASVAETRQAATASGDLNAANRSAQALKMAEALADDVARIRDESSYDHHVAWVETSGYRSTLNYAPVEAAPILSAYLFPSVTFIGTSATVAVGGGFDAVTRRFGLTWPAPGTDKAPAHDCLVVDTPFDYARQGFLYCPTHLPGPKDQRFSPAVHDELARLATAAGGRTLALFTSKSAMQAAAAALRAATSLDVYVQGELPRGELIDRFRSRPNTVLVATQSFWVGVDLPGDALTLVTIDKIPFPRPNDPVHQARRDAVEARRGNSFGEVDLPRAATLLAQGAGRLIRSRADHGVVCVFDKRLATSGYRQFLLDTLPPLRRVTDRDRVVAALEWIAANADAD